MAGQPKVFVPGPSIGFPNIGTPQQFIQGISGTINDFRTNAQRDQQLEDTKLFRDQSLELDKQKQAFTEAEPERAIAEALLKREQDNADAKLFLQARDSAGGSLLPQFLARPEVQAEFKRMNISDQAEQAALVKQMPEFLQLFSNPITAGNTALENRIASGGSLEQGRTASQGAIDSIFGPQLDAKLAAEEMKQRNATSNALMASLFKGGLSGTGGRSGSAVQGSPSQINEEELRDVLTGRMNIEDARGGGWVDAAMNLFGGVDETRDTWDVLKRDLDQGDVDRLIGTYGNRYPQNAIVGAMRSIVNPDEGTIDQKKWQNILNDPESDSAIAFKNEIESWQAKSERTRGGTSAFSGMSAKDIFTIADGLQQANDARNTDIIRRTTPQEASFESRLSAFRRFTGQPSSATAPTDTSRQGPGSGGNSNAGGTGSPGLDRILAVDPKEGSSPGTPADFNEAPQIFPQTAPPGTTPPVVDNQLFNSAQVNNPNVPALLESLATGGPAPISQGPVSTNDANKIFTAQNANFVRDEAIAKKTGAEKDEQSLQSLIARTTPPEDLSGMTPRERKVGLVEAKKLLKEGKISRDDAPSGGTLNDKLMISYLRYKNANPEEAAVESGAAVTTESIQFAGGQSIKVLRNAKGEYAIPSRPNKWYTKKELLALAK
jgi:hypothetical protein